MMTKEIASAFGEPVKGYPCPVCYDIYTDPKEERPLDRWGEIWWVRWPVGQVLVDHAASLKEEPPIHPGTPDPYIPARR